MGLASIIWSGERMSARRIRQRNRGPAGCQNKKERPVGRSFYLTIKGLLYLRLYIFLYILKDLAQKPHEDVPLDVSQSAQLLLVKTFNDLVDLGTDRDGFLRRVQLVDPPVLSADLPCDKAAL